MNYTPTPVGDLASDADTAINYDLPALRGRAPRCLAGPWAGWHSEGGQRPLLLIGRPFDRDLGAATGRRVRLANDADCFTVSEGTDGAGAGHAVVFGVILGTGVGVFVLALLTGNLARGAEIKLTYYGVWDYFPFGAFADDHHAKAGILFLALGILQLQPAVIHHYAVGILESEPLHVLAVGRDDFHRAGS